MQVDWQTLPQEMYKVNWDMAIDSTNRRKGIDIIVRDNVGMVNAARSLTLFVLCKNLWWRKC
jgi:hypothetical protein